MPDTEFINQETANPFNILGPHESPTGIIVRVFRPEVDKISVKLGNTALKARSIGNGLFEAEFSGHFDDIHYSIICNEDRKDKFEEIDPYSFPPEISNDDMYLYKEGQLKFAYRTFGAHITVRDGISGVRFIVWAPNARYVSVTGDFTFWNNSKYPMENVEGSGIWELFVPGIGSGALYKYCIKFQNGNMELKSDPFSFLMEKRPRTASVVTDMKFQWTDEPWIKNRSTNQGIEAPMSIYEVHLGSWKKPWDEREFIPLGEVSDDLISYAKEAGFTHIELMPIMEHPLDESWGYQVVNYFAPTSRYGAPADYMRFIDACHAHGIGVILDWVPAHFPEDAYGLSMFDGTNLYDHSDPRRGRHPDWGTRIFNLSRYEVINYLLANAVFWVDMYHADGIRVDAVSSMLYLDYSRKEGEWVPNIYGGRENIESITFFREMNRFMHENFPGILTIAEESTAWPGVTKSIDAGGLGFDFKWNMGWMHDTLDYFSKDPVYRKYLQGTLTFTIWYAFSETFILPLSHDEVVHMKGSLIQKMPGDEWQKFANLRAMFSFMLMSPGKKLIFMGSEFGQSNEWNVKESLNWTEYSKPLNAGLTRLLKDMMQLYLNSGISENDCNANGFEWVDYSDFTSSVLSFYRRGGGKALLAVFNLTPVPRQNYVVGVDRKGFYREVINTDSINYGGSNLGNFGGVHSEDTKIHGRDQGIRITLPPLACVIFEEA